MGISWHIRLRSSASLLSFSISFLSCSVVEPLGSLFYCYTPSRVKTNMRVSHTYTKSWAGENLISGILLRYYYNVFTFSPHPERKNLQNERTMFKGKMCYFFSGKGNNLPEGGSCIEHYNYGCVGTGHMQVLRKIGCLPDAPARINESTKENPCNHVYQE